VSNSHSGIPGSVIIKWEKSNGEIVEREVNVGKNMPRGFWNRDTIIFNIDDNDNVVVSFKMKDVGFEVDSKGKEINL